MKPNNGNYRVLRRPAVEEITGLARSSIYALMKKGEFPKAVRLTEKAVAWREAEIVEWLQSRQAA